MDKEKLDNYIQDPNIPGNPQREKDIDMDWQLLEEELRDFDYTYNMSDDYRVWRARCDNEERIRVIINFMARIDKDRVEALIKRYRKNFGVQFEVK